MALFHELAPDPVYLSRSDQNEPLSSFSKYGFELDGCYWPSVEHYYQAMKFDDEAYREKIRFADHPRKARKYGRSRLKRIRADWKKVREVIMTRAVYIKCRTHSDLASLLLQTGERELVENSQFDYYWGCGRDSRGRNTYGKVLMKVRDKLLSERDE